MAISPFSKPHYVSHTAGDHTSMLAFIEQRFLNPREPLHLTLRDQHANPLEDLFDFNHSPSLNAALTQAQPPAADCTPQ
jgi:phospholipase C